MILLKANKSLNTVFKKMIHTMEEDANIKFTFLYHMMDLHIIVIKAEEDGLE